MTEFISVHFKTVYHFAKLWCIDIRCSLTGSVYHILLCLSSLCHCGVRHTSSVHISFLPLHDFHHFCAICLLWYDTSVLVVPLMTLIQENLRYLAILKPQNMAVWYLNVALRNNNLQTFSKASCWRKLLSIGMLLAEYSQHSMKIFLCWHFFLSFEQVIEIDKINSSLVYESE